MSRTERLFELMQMLRRHRFPISGAKLATELGISVRTLYRDIATLQAQGAQIDGEPGLGYVLRPGFMLPPLMFSEEEIEALVLGSRWVADRADNQLKIAARNALAKISAVLPADLRHQLNASSLLIGPGQPIATGDEELSLIRSAIRAERQLTIVYTDVMGNKTERVIWPFALGFFERVRIVIAWCELRQEFRHFRTDRIIQLTVMETRYPARRQGLLKKWREIERVPVQ
ncbi:helix-turn-helix transcriptional regulator [Legionella fallonii]|uniref:Putative transcriptional regulator n=1 Tax=Legionella fallonii LLAP-10 TaxID=1212491 RepID=A0A098G658_9GAMM|nr:YafY family protein [Legionella fallonii]CEG57937.1 putative transcriptional regulator [Legionella fallonii LLAP-10]